MKICLGKELVEELKKKDSENEKNLLKNRNSEDINELNEDDVYFNSNTVKNIKLGTNTVNRVYLNNSIVYELQDIIIASKFHSLVPQKTATTIIFDKIKNQSISNYNLIGFCDANNHIAVYNSNTEYLVLNIRNSVNYAPISCHSFFYAYSNLENLYFYNFDMSKVQNMNAFCQNCNNLLTLDFSLVNNMYNVTTLFQAFYHCQKISGTLDLSLLNPESITTLQATFGDCKNINIIRFSDKKFSTSAISMYWTFRSCSKLQTIFANKITSNSSEVFSGCSSLVGGNGTLYNSSQTSAVYARVDGENGLPGYFTAPAANNK